MKKCHCCGREMTLTEEWFNGDQGTQWCLECGYEKLVETEYGYYDPNEYYLDVDNILDDDLSEVEFFCLVKMKG